MYQYMHHVTFETVDMNQDNHDLIVIQQSEWLAP